MKHTAKIIDILLIVECPLCDCMTRINRSQKTISCPDCEIKLVIPQEAIVTEFEGENKVK
jgi:hypothetical protein